MTREEIIQLIEDSSTKSIMVFLERTDTSVYPNNLPPATIVTNVVHFSSTPTMSDGSVADWRMTRSKSDILDGFTWYSIGTFRGDGTQVDNWTSPILVKIGKDGADGLNGKPGEDGYNGTDGADGSNIEYVFKLVEDIDAFNVLDPIPPEDNDPTQTGYVPDGWENHPQGISEDMLIEAMCYRTMNIETRRWNNFVGPYIWSQWGVAGKDGDGVEYIYRLATLGDGTSEGEAEYNYSTGIYTLKESYWPPTNQAAYDALPQADKEAWDAYDSANYPNNWIDDQQSVSNAKPVQFVSSRKYDGEHKKWGFFSEPKMWNKIPLADVNVTAFTAFAFAITPYDISNIKPEGGSADDPDPKDIKITIEGETIEIPWHDSIPSSGTGYVWMTTSFWKDGAISDSGWSHPRKVNDSQGFQAEYASDDPDTGYSWDKPKLPNFGEGAWAENEVAWRAEALRRGCGVWKDCKSNDPADFIEDPSFMATCQKKGGVWTDWVVTKLKGENGLNPVKLDILNDEISVNVDVNNHPVIATANNVSIELQRDSDKFPIASINNVTFLNHQTGSAVLPQGISISNKSISSDDYWCNATINISTELTLTEPFLIRVTAVSGDYDATDVIKIIPYTSKDAGHSYLEVDSRDIHRTYTGDGGSCEYNWDPFHCYGFRIVGDNPPVAYGTIVYATSAIDDGTKHNIRDEYKPESPDWAGYITYTGGISIKGITGHENLTHLYVYLISTDNIVVDREYISIDTVGHYELTVSPVNSIKIINDDHLETDEIYIYVWYYVSENKKSLVTDRCLRYYFNGIEGNIRTCNNRNATKITISQLVGFSYDNLSSLTFVLKTNDRPDGVTLAGPLTLLIGGADGKDGDNGTNGITYRVFDIFTSSNNPSYTPATPPQSSSCLWNIDTDILTGIPSGWTLTCPDPNTSNLYVWRSSATFSSANGQAIGAWSAPVRVNQLNIVVTSDNIYYKAYPANETATAPTESQNPLESPYYWWRNSSDPGYQDYNISSNKPNLWSFRKTVYSDGLVVQSNPVIIRYFINAIDQDTINTITSDVTTNIKKDLKSLDERLDGVEGAYAVTDIISEQGLISIITNYKDGQNKSFADIIVNAAEGAIDTIVGAAMDNNSTSVGQKMNAIDGTLTSHASSISSINGDITDVRNTMDGIEGSITTTVAKAKYCWIKNSDNTNPDDPPVKPYDGEETMSGYTKQVIASEMSAIKQDSGEIRAFVTDHTGHLSAGLAILKDFEVRTGESGSAVVLDAAHIILNGTTIANAIEADSLTVTRGNICVQNNAENPTHITQLTPNALITNCAKIQGTLITDSGFFGTVWDPGASSVTLEDIITDLGRPTSSKELTWQGVFINSTGLRSSNYTNTTGFELNGETGMLSAVNTSISGSFSTSGSINGLPIQTKISDGLMSIYVWSRQNGLVKRAEFGIDNSNLPRLAFYDTNGALKWSFGENGYVQGGENKVQSYSFTEWNFHAIGDKDIERAGVKNQTFTYNGTWPISTLYSYNSGTKKDDISGTIWYHWPTNNQWDNNRPWDGVNKVLTTDNISQITDADYKLAGVGYYMTVPKEVTNGVYQYTWVHVTAKPDNTHQTLDIKKCEATKEGNVYTVTSVINSTLNYNNSLIPVIK